MGVIENLEPFEPPFGVLFSTNVVPFYEKPLSECTERGFGVVSPACKLDTSCNCFPFQVRFLPPICYFLQLNGVKNQLYI